MKAVFKTTGGKDPVKDSTLSFSEGERIFSQGDLGTEMFIIQEGKIEIQLPRGAETLKPTILGPGDFFGELSLFEDQRRDTTAKMQCLVRPRGFRIEPVEHTLGLLQGGGKLGQPQAALAGAEVAGLRHTRPPVAAGSLLSCNSRHRNGGNSG